MDPTPSSGLPAHPALRPGTRWARCGPGRWQVALAPVRLVVDDGPGVLPLLEALAGNAVDDGVLGHLDAWPCAVGPAAGRALRALLAADLVVDGDALLRSAHGAAVRVRAAAWSVPGRDGDEVLARRAGSTVLLTGSSPAAPRVLALLLAAGCRARQGPRDRPTRGRHLPDLVVDLSLGEPDRALLDPWQRAGVAHLPVADHGLRARMGPFTVPGRTGCLRCRDAHEDARGRASTLVASQHTGAPRGLLVPEDAALPTLLVGWVARDVLAHLDGHRPTTWSAVVELDPVAVPEVHPVARHPHCGCAWDLTG